MPRLSGGVQPAFIWLVCAVAIRLASAQIFDAPRSFFLSRPDLEPPLMTVHIHEDTVDPGYVFVTPYQQRQSGPYIFDKSGELVWSGFGEIGPFNAHNLHVCEWREAPHLCLFQGNQLFGYARGHGIILNQDYKIVKTIESVGEVPALDQHEFRLTKDDTFLVSIYEQVPYDLSSLNFVGDLGWVMDSLFQEINSTDNSVIFQWSALNHVSPFESYVYPRSSDISGSGEEPQSPWDFFHINSVFKSSFTGNYLISARHMSSLYYINATDGSIIWKLQAGGDSDFACLDFAFAFQHDAEIHSETEDEMLLTLYDNASNNANLTAEVSSAKFIRLDFNAMTASLYRPSAKWKNLDPGGPKILSASQGNAQLLANDNMFVGWGSWPRFSEHAPDGTTIWSAWIGERQGENMVYRAYSSPWKSIPSHTKPSLWTYSRTSDALIAFYVSWNGCTETASWNFYGANDMSDIFTLIGNTRRTGFETSYTSESHYAYTFAEALGPSGESLRNSSMQSTWVPSAALAVGCNSFNCRGDPPELAMVVPEVV